MKKYIRIALCLFTALLPLLALWAYWHAVRLPTLPTLPETKEMYLPVAREYWTENHDRLQLLVPIIPEIPEGAKMVMADEGSAYYVESIPGPEIVSDELPVTQALWERIQALNDCKYCVDITSNWVTVWFFQSPKTMAVLRYGPLYGPEDRTYAEEENPYYEHLTDGWYIMVSSP